MARTMYATIIGATVRTSAETTRPRRLRSFKNSALASLSNDHRRVWARGSSAVTIVVFTLLPPIET
jgi:hypothetical protein